MSRISTIIPQDPNAPERASPGRPAVGVERTSQQSRPGGDLGVPFIHTADGALTGRRCATRAGAATVGQDATGLPPCPAGTYDVYRQMLRDPTIQLARAVVFGPLLGSPWRFVKAFPDADDQLLEFVRQVYAPLESQLKGQLLRALDFGCRSFEQCYDVRDVDGSLRVAVRKFKPLRPDLTRPMVDRATGGYAGLRNGGVTLSPEETLHYAYDLEDDDWYGRSRMENVRENAWWPWVCHQHTSHRLGRKVSSIVPIVKGPISQKEVDTEGREFSGYAAGQLIIDALSRGDGVMMENLISGVDDLTAAGVSDFAKATRWVIDTVDIGSSATAIGPIIDTLRYYDALKLRGWLRPERTATEGQHGTKSEVAEQADVGLAEGEQLHLDMVNVVNWHSVDRLLAWNFGDAARGQVRIEPTPLIDEKRAVYRFIFTTLLQNPAIIDLLASRLDLDAMAESLGIPTTGDINPDVDGLDDPTDPFTDPAENAGQQQQQQQQGGGADRIAASRGRKGARDGRRRARR